MVALGGRLRNDDAISDTSDDQVSLGVIASPQRLPRDYAELDGT